MTALKPFIVFVAIIVTWLTFTLTVNFGVPFLERHLFGMPESEYIWIGCNSNLDDFSSGTPAGIYVVDSEGYFVEYTPALAS